MGGKDRPLTLPVCQPRQQQGGRSQVGRGVGSQAGIQQGELAEEAAQVLGSWCHGDQRQQDILVIDHGGDLAGQGGGCGVAACRGPFCPLGGGWTADTLPS